MLFVRQGIQIGVQAKLVASDYMLLQALPPVANIDRPDGPQYRCVVFYRAPGRTPKARRERLNEISFLAAHTRLLLATPGEEWINPYLNRSISELRGKRGIRSPSPYGYRWGNRAVDWRYYNWRPRKLEYVPPFVPEHEAGVPSPRAIGPWQIAAVTMELICRTRGYVCLDDAKTVTKDVGGSWNASTLMQRHFQATGERINGTRQRKWVLPDYCGWRPPSRKWPEVAKALEGTIRITGQTEMRL